MAKAKAAAASVLDAMTVEMWPVSRLIEYASNPREISDASVTKTAASIKEFGFRVPIIVDAEGVIIAGHTRLRASKQLGLEVVPVHVAEGLTAAQAKAFRIMENRSHDESKWDNELLGLELAEISDLGEIDLEFTGFDPDQIHVLIDGPSFNPVSEDEQGRLDEKKKIICPNCSHEFSPS